MKTNCKGCGRTVDIELADLENEPLINSIQICHMNDLASGRILCALCDIRHIKTTARSRWEQEIEQ